MVLLVSLACVALLVAATPLVPGSDQGAQIEGTGPAIIVGRVTDLSFVPLEGADVNVSLIDPGDSSLRAYGHDATDSGGLYSVTFMDTWEIGDTILVVADHGVESGTNSSVLLDPNTYMIQYVNVTVGTAIPEFSGLGTFVSVGGVLAMFMVVFSARRRKNT
jgi:hypothetical protein